MIDEARAKDYDLGAMSDYSDFLNRIDESGTSLKVKEINDLNAETDALQLDVNRLIEQTQSIERVVAALGLDGIEFEGSDSLENPTAVFQ